MAIGDLTLVYFGRSYTFTFSGSAITPFTQVFAVDDIVRFTTTGTLPTGLALNTSYYVVSVGSTITVSATQGGSAISLSGGSGTHSIRVVLTVNPRYFLDDTPPRRSAPLSGKGSFSVDGNFIVSGISFEPPQEYELRHKATIAERDIYIDLFCFTDKIRH